MPQPRSPPSGSETGLLSKFTFVRFYFIVSLSACKLLVKIPTDQPQLTELLRNLNISYLTPPKGSGDGANFIHCHAYLLALGNHGLIVGSFQIL